MVIAILKGIMIGLANILPGVSGGTLAVSMGIYDKIIHCITHFFQSVRENILFLTPIAMGMVIAIAGSAFGIGYLFEKFPLETNFFFIGLILGGLPAIYAKVKYIAVKPIYIALAMGFFVLVTAMGFFNGVSGGEKSLDRDFLQWLYLILVGILAAATMVIPGISGSMVLLLLGCYNPLLEMIKTFIWSVVNLEFTGIINSAMVLMPFGIGIVIGVAAIAKLVEFIFERYPLYAYWSIIGLLTASPIAILLVAELPVITGLHLFSGGAAFVAGWGIARSLGE